MFPYFKNLERNKWQNQLRHALTTQKSFVQDNTKQGCNQRGDRLTAAAPKFSDTLTLSQPRGADSAHHRRGRS